MFKITTAKDIDMIRGKFNQNVISECERLAKIFDDNYNCVSMYGGCAIIVENMESLYPCQAWSLENPVFMYVSRLFLFLAF